MRLLSNCHSWRHLQVEKYIENLRRPEIVINSPLDLSHKPEDKEWALRKNIVL